MRARGLFKYAEIAELNAHAMELPYDVSTGILKCCIVMSYL